MQLSFNFTNLSQSISPGKWKETTGLEIEGFPRQLYGNDCGIFMLMYVLYTVLDAPYDFTVMDMPVLRKRWCVMLMENSDLGSHGKMFAHWTDTSKAILRDEVSPVFRLKKRRMDDITEEEEQLQPVAQPQQASVSIAKEAETTVEADNLEIKIVHDCERAAEWVETNQHLFSGKVELPAAVQMGEEELAEATQQYARLWVEEESADMDDQESEGILERFKFLFSKIEDVDI